MASSWAEELAERIWRAEIALQRAQRNLRLGTDEARNAYATALLEMERTHRMVTMLCDAAARRERDQGQQAEPAMLQ